MVAGGVHGWGDMCGCRGACVVACGACVVARGTCMVAGGVRGCGGHAWLRGAMHRIQRDTVSERAVHILLECILVEYICCLRLVSSNSRTVAGPGFLRHKGKQDCIPVGCVPPAC